MSTKKNQKRYNKAVMQTGLEANKYTRDALKLINQYTQDYAGRQEFWQSKLNERQLDLLSDEYLAKNAAMLRGNAAFGSNSTLNQQIQQNAYDQQNYLANVANKNVQMANALQQNELSALSGAAQTYQRPVEQGMAASVNVDNASNSWLGALGTGLQAVGTVASFIPGAGTVIGQGLNLAGGALRSMSSDTALPANYGNQAQLFMKGAPDKGQIGALDIFKGSGLSTTGQSSTTLATNTNSLSDTIRNATNINTNNLRI